MKSSLTLLLVYSLTQTFAMANASSFVVTTEPNSNKENYPQENVQTELKPEIYELRIESNVSNRFAHTLVTSKMRNRDGKPCEAKFSIVLPEKAFISEFTMVVGGQNYKAYVKEQEKARHIYRKAVEEGLGAAHVVVTPRESNHFTVSVNVEAFSKATFLLKYEELLRLNDNKYELVININPYQPVEDLFVNVMINESIPLKFVQTPPLRTGNEIRKVDGDVDPRASIFRLDSKSALVQFKPNIERQKALAGYLGTDASRGLSGQFVVQYDVERSPNGGEVLVKDGYFVHFFAPNEYKPLNKYVVFVLDTSKSMFGQKIAQLKQAMLAILPQLESNDYFQVVSFGTHTKIMSAINPLNPQAISGHPDNIKKSMDEILGLHCGGESNVHKALQTAINLVEAEKSKGSHEYQPQAIIMFLTDGGPTAGITSTDQILSDITNLNKDQAPIYSLSFGNYADQDFLKKLSMMNHGFSRHIYEASDAAIQLENFYKQIASPLLSGVKFEYVPDATSLTKTKFPLHFAGSELVVAGKLRTSTFPEIPRIICKGKLGRITFNPTIDRPVTSLERLWAYLTVQQLLDEKDIAPNKTSNERKALDLALKYSFVTPVSSLVVVKPNSITDVQKITQTKSVRFAKERFRSVKSNFLGSNKILSHFRPKIPRKGGRSDWKGVPRSKRIDITRSRVTLRPRTTTPSIFSKFKRVSKPPGKKRMYAIIKTIPRFSLYSGSYANIPLMRVTTYVSKDVYEKYELLKLQILLPWLENSLNKNGTLISPPGGYELGFTVNFSKKPKCSETPMNTTGNCELLYECWRVHKLLTTNDKYLPYFCPLAKHQKLYAGVCCPR